MTRIEQGFRPWLRWAIRPGEHTWRPPWYVRAWQGWMLFRYGHGFATGISTPLHPEHHAWWVRLEQPLSGGICWWCGLRCYPGPLLPYGGRPRWLFNRLRRWTRVYTAGGRYT